MRRLLLLPLLALGCTAKAAADGSRTDDAPLVIELFTSQGCSSCPPADALLDKLARTGQLGGRQLAPLSFHVDYWDDLGWPDPYARSAWTTRQQDYARALDDRIYTPELVIGGRVGIVGSHATRIAQAIASAPPQRPITARATWTSASLVVEATAPAGADVYVAIWEDNTRTKVPRGENAGATLVNDRVVRRLERVASASTKATRTLPLDPTWRAGGAVAFAQRRDRSIIGAALLPKPR